MKSFIRLSSLIFAAALLAGCAPRSWPAAPGWPGLSAAPGERLLHARLNGAAPVTLKRTGVNGTVETWMSLDRFTLSLDRGVLVASRGFGHDLMAGQSEPTLLALSQGDSPPYSRRQTFLTGEDRAFSVQSECRMEPAGGGTGHNLREICRSFTQNYENFYQIGAAGEITSSKQWISPEAGQVELKYTTSG